MKKNISLIILMSLFAIVVVLFLMIGLFFQNDEVKYDFSNMEGTLYYYVDADWYDDAAKPMLKVSVDLTNEDVKEIYDIYKEYDIDYDVLTKDASIFEYEIYLEDYILGFNKSGGVTFINEDGNYYFASNDKLNKKLNDLLIEYRSRNINVYLFNMCPACSSSEREDIKIDLDDIELIREYVKDIKELDEPINLAISLNYLLVVDDKYIYFDDLDGYAMIGNKMVILPLNLRELLYDYVYPEVTLYKSTSGSGIIYVEEEMSFQEKYQLYNYWFSTDKSNVIEVNDEVSEYYFTYNDKRIYFNLGKDYVRYDDKLVRISDNFRKFLMELVSDVVPGELGNGGCCSCCPDLKPGESCIAACCPCN